eukprot:TRINITY_DN486_c0_g5_i4.p1 TRINITY_DN486_c0_g5~~TRINITY_DN486_c0_g5_i4.p1  ORF type:complete len:390 (+),score=43.75 TRINITY_DN486_c0_g5_i4:154-1323(+)
MCIRDRYQRRVHGQKKNSKFHFLIYYQPSFTMIKIQNSQQSTLNDFNQPQSNQYKVKQSKMLPFQDQSIHAFYQVEISDNPAPVQEGKTIDIETRLCRLQTSSKNYPRIVKEVDIKLSNGQLITLRDIFTTLPKTITCKSEQILVGSHSSFLTAPYQQSQQYQPQQQQQQQQSQSYQEPEQVQEESTFLAHDHHDHHDHPKNHIDISSSQPHSSIFTQKLSSEINLLQLKLNSLPLLPAAASLVNSKLASMKNDSIPMPIRPMPAIAVAKKTSETLFSSHVSTKVTVQQQLKQQQKRQQLTQIQRSLEKEGGVESGLEGGAGASLSGSSSSSSEANSTTTTNSNNTTNDCDDCGDFIIGGGKKKSFRGVCKVRGVFRVVRKNIRKEKNN